MRRYLVVASYMGECCEKPHLWHEEVMARGVKSAETKGLRIMRKAQPDIEINDTVVVDLETGVRFSSWEEQQWQRQ